jgi:hypothetical protein
VLFSACYGDFINCVRLDPDDDHAITDTASTIKSVYSPGCVKTRGCTLAAHRLLRLDAMVVGPPPLVETVDR